MDNPDITTVLDKLLNILGKFSKLDLFFNKEILKIVLLYRMFEARHKDLSNGKRYIEPVKLGQIWNSLIHLKHSKFPIIFRDVFVLFVSYLRDC